MATVLRRRTTAPAPAPTSTRVSPQGRRLAVRAKLAPLPPTALPRLVRFTTANNAASRAAATKLAKEEVDLVLQSIAKTEASLDAILAELSEGHAKVEEIMRRANVSSHTDGVYKAEISEKFNRQTRTIDPKRFKAAVRDKDFWSCVSVGVGKAEAVMSSKELDAISDVLPATSLGFVFSMKKVK